MHLKKLFLLAIPALLGSLVVTSCSQSGEEAETLSSDSRSFAIYFDDEINAQNKLKNIEIEVGSRYLLWKHISVPGGTYSLTVLNGNVSIDNHVIVANGTGAWKVKITATNSSTGKTLEHSISGTVISHEKAAFNKTWENVSANNNFTVTDEISGTVTHTKNYSEFLYGETTSGDLVYQGNVYDKTSEHWYSYQYAKSDESDLEFSPGYGVSQTILGTTGGFAEDVPSYMFVEQFDDTGASKKQAYIEDTTTVYSEDYSVSEVLDPLMEHLQGHLGNMWSTYLNTYDAAGAILSFGGDSFSLTPAKDSATPIATILDSDKKTVSTALTIDNIDTTSHEAVENWMANPVFPTQVKTTSLVSAFEKIETEKNYTMYTQAAWVDSYNNETDAPGNWGEALSAYSSCTLVADEAMVNVVTSSDENQINFLQYFGSSDWTVPAANSVTAEWITGDSKMAAAEGTYDTEEDKITYGTPVTGETEITSLWGHKTTTDESGNTSWTIPLVAEGIAEIIPNVSFFYSQSGVSSGTKYQNYYFNTGGDDWNSTDESKSRRIISWTNGDALAGLWGYLTALSMDSMTLNVGVISAYDFGRAGMEYYFNYGITVTSSYIDVFSYLYYDSSHIYSTDIIFADIGSTELDSATQALVDATRAS